ncbi:MAG: 30S ribosomal protein S20 [Oscillospiraceae bacterium]|jgi:small subunit ribosomal protein S20|nr:30S ribosomal protein S20 [Oscillospiraceae bacterium]
MPNIKSAKKRVKVIKVKALQNKMRKSALKTTLKTTLADVNENTIRLAIKKVDQACANGLMHKNAASRKKSQLMRKLNAVK